MVSVYCLTERGRNGLAQRRSELGRLLWKLWSPTSSIDDATYGRTAASFENADFVDVVIHSYRRRMGDAAGDPRYAPIEARLATLPRINGPDHRHSRRRRWREPAQETETHQKSLPGHYQRRFSEDVVTIHRKRRLSLCGSGAGSVQAFLT